MYPIDCILKLIPFESLLGHSLKRAPALGCNLIPLYQKDVSSKSISRKNEIFRLNLLCIRLPCGRTDGIEKQWSFLCVLANCIRLTKHSKNPPFLGQATYRPQI